MLTWVLNIRLMAINRKRKYPPSKSTTKNNSPLKDSVVLLALLIFGSLSIYLGVSSPSIQELNESIPTMQDPLNFQCSIILPISLLVCSSKTIQKAIMKKDREFEEVKGWFIAAICGSSTMLLTSLIKIWLNETNREFSILSGGIFILGILMSIVVVGLFDLKGKKF